MKQIFLYVNLSFLFFLFSGPIAAATLSDVQSQDRVRCGLDGETLGFSLLNVNGTWEGFDVDFCRAVAAAVLKDEHAISVKHVSAQTRLASLASHEIDLLLRTTTWTYSRDTEYEIDFVGPIFYDGQGIMVLKELQIKTPQDLEGAKICLSANTTAPKNAQEFFGKEKVQFQPVVINSPNNEYMKTFFEGKCDAVITDVSSLASHRQLRAKNPKDYEILNIIISREPLSIGVHENDDEWQDVIKWVHNAMIWAEKYNITSQNVEDLKKTSNDPQIKRFLGVTPGIGTVLNLDDEWAYRVIKRVGNYGEIFEKNISQKINLERHQNQLVEHGGLMYAPEF